MFSRIRSAVCAGIEGRNVYVETDVARGLPGIFIVGLASTMIMESRERIKSAIINSGFEYPRSRITVNLTPASLRKNGSCLDLPIAAGILVSGGSVDPGTASDCGIIGELSLDGRVLGVSGVLPMIEGMYKAGIRRVIIPHANSGEAALVRGMEIFPVDDLKQCIDILNGCAPAIPEISEMNAGAGALLRRYCEGGGAEDGTAGDFADINGQETAKRAIVLAVTGRHGLLMVGSPGCGKTMLTSRIPTIMPPMTEKELIETAMIYSASGRSAPEDYLTLRRPFRHPHHTIGRAGLLGGGLYPVPGEISLAHNGVLFLDEICEFDRDTIESLRIPVEERRITHFRRGEAYTFPCSFQLVMASNPCPCGYYGDSEHRCTCTQAQLERYQKKLSGPMMDRIDMKVTMEKVTYDELRQESGGMDSASMRKMAEEGIRFARASGRDVFNSAMSDQDIEKWCRLGDEEERFMRSAYDVLGLSPRSYKRTLKVARTAADIACSAEIRKEHLAEALSYRLTE